MKKIVLISGKMGHGKDTFANFLKSHLEKLNKKVCILHYGDYVKYCLSQYYGWNGKKDQAGRSLLQHFGTEVVRAKDPDFWVNTIINLINVLYDEWDYFLIPDTRMENEIELVKDAFQDKVLTVRIERYNEDSSRYLNPAFSLEQHFHITETALDYYHFDYYIDNFTLNELNSVSETLAVDLEFKEYLKYELF